MRTTCAAAWVFVVLALVVPAQARPQTEGTVPPPPPPSYIWDMFPKPRPPTPGAGPEELGFVVWSADGRYAVYDKRIALGGALVSHALFVSAVSGRSRTEKRFDEAGYKEWIESNPEAERLDGEPIFERGVRAVINGEGEWEGIDPPHWKLKGNPGAKLRCSIRRNGMLLPSHISQVPPGAVDSRIDLYWAPDGRRIAWLFQGKAMPPSSKAAAPDEEPKLIGFGELVIDRTVGPRIEIAGDKALGPEVFDRVADAIEKAGYAPTGQRAAKGGARSVVYAVPAWKADAARIAAAVPGGAEVSTMPAARNGFEVVVALARKVPAAP